MTERRQSYASHLFNFYLLFQKNIRSCWYSRGSRYTTEVHFFSLPLSAVRFFTENPMVDPWIKWRKTKETQQMLIERFLALLLIGLVPYPFFLKDPAALLPAKLVCLWFLRLAKQIAKWWDMPSHLARRRLLRVLPYMGSISKYSPKSKVFSRFGHK